MCLASRFNEYLYYSRVKEADHILENITAIIQENEDVLPMQAQHQILTMVIKSAIEYVDQTAPITELTPNLVLTFVILCSFEDEKDQCQSM